MSHLEGVAVVDRGGLAVVFAEGAVVIPGQATAAEGAVSGTAEGAAVRVLRQLPEKKPLELYLVYTVFRTYNVSRNYKPLL